MTYKFYYLKNPSLDFLLIYKAKYEAASGTSVSIEYLQKADTFCFFSGPEMVGGLVLSSALNGNTFRYFSIFRNNTEGEAILRTLKRKFSVDEKESAEIACIWMNRKLDPKKRIIFYKVMLEETQKFVRSKNVKYIFGGSVDLYIQKFQEQFFSKVFYLGSIPKTDESVLSHRSGTAVMIYFSEAKSLNLQKFRLIYNLWRSIFMHKVSKLVLQIKPITVKQSA